MSQREPSRQARPQELGLASTPPQSPLTGPSLDPAPSRPDATWHQYAEGLLRMAAELNSAEALDVLLQRLVQTAAELLAVAWVAIATNEGDHALRRYTWDQHTWSTHAERLPLDGSLSGWVIRHRRAFRSSDASGARPDEYEPATNRFKDSLAVPMLAQDGHALGSLNFHERHDGRPFTDDDQRLAEAMAHHAAVAIERARLLVELQTRAKRLEAQAAEQDAFIHTVSHALKTPLTSIVAMAGLFEQQADTTLTGPPNGLAVIVRNGERMGRLIDDLLRFAQATVGVTELEFQPVCLEDVVQAATQELFAPMQSRDVRLMIESPLPLVYGHSGRLTEVVTNLLGNAIKYTPLDRQPRIRVWASVGEGMVTCSVCDNGIGIPPEQRERVFQLFQRLEGGPEVQAAGSGVGLAVVARVIEQHGGRVWVDDGLDGGSCVRFTLPAPPATVPPKQALHRSATPRAEQR